MRLPDSAEPVLRTKYHLLLPVLVLAAVLSACAHTRVINTWRDPEHQRFPKKVLVHAMAMSPTVKILFENVLVERLKERGVDALASHGILPDSMEFDKEAMKRIVREKGIDAIFVAHTIDNKVIETFRSEQWYYGGAVYFDSEGSFVMSAVGSTGAPGTYIVDQASVEFILFDVPAKKRVWVVQTKTSVRDTRTEEVKPMVDTIMEQLRADKMVP